MYAVYLLSSRANLSQPEGSVLVRQGGEHLVKLDLFNSELTGRNYTISVVVDGRRYDENIFLGAGRAFTYKHHIYAPVQDRRVNVSVYKENELVSENTYIIE